MYNKRRSGWKLTVILMAWAITASAQPVQQVPNVSDQIGAKGRVENIVVGTPAFKPGASPSFEIKTTWKVFVPQFLVLRTSDLFLTVTYADGSTKTSKVLVATCSNPSGGLIPCEGKVVVPAKLLPAVPLKSFSANARAFYNPKFANAEEFTTERQFILTPENNFSAPGIAASSNTQEILITGIIKTGQQATHPNRFKVTWFVKPPVIPFVSFQVSVSGGFNFTGGNPPKTFSAGGGKQVSNVALREVEIDIDDSRFRNDPRKLTQMQASVTIKGRRDQTNRQPAEAQVSGNF